MINGIIIVLCWISWFIHEVLMTSAAVIMWIFDLAVFLLEKLKRPIQ